MDELNTGKTGIAADLLNTDDPNNDEELTVGVDFGGHTLAGEVTYQKEKRELRLEIKKDKDILSGRVEGKIRF